MELVYIEVDKLQEYENNARMHGAEDIAAIEESIKAFGFNDPIGIWSDDNIIVEGHGRLRAARNLGIQKVPCVRLDWLSDDERKAYALAHNKTAELSSWDYSAVDEEIQRLQNFDMEAFGFTNYQVSDDDLNEILSDKPPKESEPKKYQCPVCGEWFEL